MDTLFSTYLNPVPSQLGPKQSRSERKCSLHRAFLGHRGGGGRALLEQRGEGGRGSRGGGGVVRGGSPRPPAGMNHIDQELQKCTTLTHSVYTSVIMPEHR